MLFKNMIICHLYGSRLSYHRSWVGLFNNKLAAGNTPYITIVDNMNTDFMNLDPNTSLVGRHLCKYFNRHGVLCGKCISGYSPSINSEYQCIRCTAKDAEYRWVLYLLTVFGNILFNIWLHIFLPGVRSCFYNL